MKYNKEKGVTLYLSVVIMSIMMSIVLGISTIVFYQIKIVKGLGDSVVSFYAADTGIERILYDDKVYRDTHGVGIPAGTSTTALSNGASYLLDFDDGAINIKSIGTYKQTNRAIEIAR